MKMEKVDIEKQSPKKASRAPQSFEEAALDFENSKIIGLKLSRKIAWAVAAAALLISLLCVLALLVALFNHTDPQPVVYEKDSKTGSIIQMKTLKDTPLKSDEVTDKYWIATYIRHREGYDWHTVGTESEIVKLMSASDVGSEYMRTIQADTAPLNMLKDKGKIVVKIASITFVGEIAQVRFTKQRVNTSGENLDGSPEQSFIATLSYRFDNGAMTDQQRLSNPLGFKTMTYRVVDEVIK
ncbi:type IV secretion system protein [Massilia sp. CCM 9210]|uniref:virB8 family protein n=1 Tax=Massilia scottii TaxID=3057166 RepID=UPI00279644E6|nr:type IV secretion system protein [Massilia sp. CCM 9210]MDQ1817823.1 type IV secretion system protein [Massilia sp. CCM 9210]